MSAQQKPNAEDMESITWLHSQFVDRINDAAMALQDAAYNVGRRRGLLDGKAQRNELLAALQGVVKVADRATVEFDRARAAIAKATGSAT